MKENDLIKVLWVEDDPEVTATYPLKAELFDLELVPFPCWDDAKTALEGKYDTWAAIILDAKCKFHRDSKDNAVVFLSEALTDITGISKEKGRIIPWYILTGGAENEVSDSIIENRMMWDADWTKSTNKKYYSKNVDNESLFTRIRMHAQKSSRIQVIGMYHKIYEQLRLLNDDDVCENILTILEAMHFPQSHMDFNPRLYYNPMRKALERVFRLAGHVGIIPEEFFNGGNVNLNQCFMFLIGRDAEKLGYRYGMVGERVAPRYIHDMMSLIINLGNYSSHSTEQSHSTDLSETEIQKYDQQIQALGVNSKLLLFSITLQFCEILQWMNHYIQEHPDKEKNLTKCVRIPKEQRESLRGRINKGLNKISFSSKYIIDRNNGFDMKYSPKEYKYKENEEVLFELRKTKNPKSGNSFSFAINVKPSSVEKLENGSK